MVTTSQTMATLPHSWVDYDNCDSWFVNHSLVFCSQMEMNRYCIEVDRIEPNGEIFTLVEYRNLKATKSTIGRDRQMNNLVNRIGEELRYYQVPHKRYTVSVA